MGRGGLKFALDMSQCDDHNKRVELVSKYFTRAQVPHLFRECTYDYLQDERTHFPVNRLCEKDLAHRRRDPMPFRGDDNSSALLNGDTDLDNGSVAQVSTICGPPLAWVIMWDEKYCNLYGEYIPRLFRECGYVLWDEQRWNTIPRARQMLLSSWKSSREYKIVKEHCVWLRDLP